ncbi:MAG: ComEC/Rec2 family competence protein [Spirochaetes bacterium]|nr:ComEC/Rec2 family competence protein [Spirochaetota bacterium]
MPSLFIVLSVSAAILFACAHAVDGMLFLCGSALLLLAVISLPIVYRNALRVGPSGAGRTGFFRISGRGARMALLLFLAAFCSIYVAWRVDGMLSPDMPSLGRSVWIATVENVVNKRYYREAVIRFHNADFSGDGSDGPAQRHRGVVRASGGSFGAGDTIRFTGKPVVVDQKGAGSSRGTLMMLMRGVRYIFYLDGAPVTVVRDETSNREKVRELLAQNCDALFKRKTAAMVKALYFGNQDYIDKLTMNDFKRAGVFHILSAGGLHVGVVAAIPVFLLGLARVNRRIAMIAAVLTVLAYLSITDMPVSLLRSCLMFCTFAVQRIVGRETNIYNALFLSAAVVLLLFPGEIFGLGFQLSYGATMGILLFHARYRKAISWLPAIAANPIALTLSAQLLVLPVLLFRMNELNLAGLVSNIVVVPLMSFLLVLSIAANALSFVPVVAAWVAGMSDAVYWLAGRIVCFMSGLGGHYYVDAPGPLLAVAFVLLVAPLLPPFRGIRPVSLSILAAVLTAWLSLGGPMAAVTDSVTEVRHDRGTLLLVKNGATLSIIGRYPGRHLTDRLLGEIASVSCRDIDLHLPHADYEDVSACSRLLRRLPVSRCCLTGGFRLRGYIRRFFTLLETDGVDLVIDEMVRPGPEDGLRRLYGALSPPDTGQNPGGKVKKRVRFLTLH